MGENPYESPFTEPGGMGAGGMQPHRGVLVLLLGVFSILVSAICCLLMPLPVGAAIGIPAGILGYIDLKKIKSGEMDPDGHSMTLIGMLCGITGAALGLLGFIVIAGAMIFALASGVQVQN